MNTSPQRFILGAIFLFSACASVPDAITDAERAEIAEEIAALHEALRTAWIEGDALAQGQIHSANGTITFDSRRFGGEAFLGWAERTGTNAAKQQVGPLSNLQIDVLSRESAASVFDFNAAFLDSLGVPGTEFSAKMTLVWALEEDRWKVLHLHETTKDIRAESVE